MRFLAVLVSLVVLAGCTVVPIYDKNGNVDSLGIKVVDAAEPGQVEGVANQISAINRQSGRVAGEVLNNPLVQILAGVLGVGGIAETTRRVVNASNNTQREKELKLLKEQRKREDALYDEALSLGAKVTNA